MENDKENKPVPTEHTQSFNLGDSYFEDEAVYPEYSETEAEQIVVPTEELLQTAEADEKLSVPEVGHTEAVQKKKRKLISSVFRFFSNLIYALGENTIDLSNGFSKKQVPSFSCL